MQLKRQQKFSADDAFLESNSLYSSLLFPLSLCEWQNGIALSCLSSTQEPHLIPFPGSFGL